MSDLDDLIRDFVEAVQGPPIRLGPIGRTLVPGWVEWVQGGTQAADWWVLVSGFMGATERLHALRSILERMEGPPIDPKRWAVNRDILQSALEDLGMEVRQLAEARGWEAVDEVVSATLTQSVDYTDPENTASEGAMRAFQRALTRLICEDLLGPGWRRHQCRETALPQEPPWVAEEVGAVEVAWRATEALLAEINLSPAEQELWEAYRETDDWSVAGAALRLSSAALRQRKHRLLSKLTPIKEALRAP